MTSGRIHLIHCTTPERARTIATQGLLPGNEERGNYQDSRWLPLDGVYLTDQPGQIQQYRRAHGLDDHGLVLVEADPTALLPDEDVIEILLGKALQSVGGRPWAEMAEMDDDEEMPPASHPMWNDLREAFLRMAGPRSDDPLREGDLDELIDWWATHTFSDGGQVDPWEWAALKDRVVRAYPAMTAPGHDIGSKRHPGPIGFDAPTRIVAVVVCEDGVATTITGAVPSGAADLVRSMLDDDVAADIREEAR